MGKRLLTSFIGIAIFFAVVLAPYAYVLYIAVALLTLGMLYEMYKVMGASKPVCVTGYVAALLVLAGFVFNKPVVAVLAAITVFMIAMVFTHGKATSENVLSAGFITVAISALMSMLIFTRRYCDKYTVMLPFVCAWLTDTGAFTIGNLCGKHKLAEKISPKKTVEGAVGGLIFSTIGAAAYICVMTYIFANGHMPRIKYIVVFALLGFLASIVAQLGDLAASCIKRDFQKKDYGNILPGHGGLLDRFDSVLLAIPFVYYAMRHFIM